MGADIAWVFQPFLAFCGAAVGLCVYALIEPLVSSVRVRTLVAFLSSQSALLYGYSLWGGVKELASAFLLVLDGRARRRRDRQAADKPPGLHPAGVAAGALIQTLGIGAAAWVGLTLGAVGGSWLVSGMEPCKSWGRASPRSWRSEWSPPHAWCRSGWSSANSSPPTRPLLERPVRTDQTRKPDRAAERLPTRRHLAGGRLPAHAAAAADGAPDRPGADAAIGALWVERQASTSLDWRCTRRWRWAAAPPSTSAAPPRG